MYGGRGAGRSWGAGRALPLLMVKRWQEQAIPTRVLCARELQKSIAESVHRLLTDQILELGLQDFFEIEVNRIKGPGGGYIVFEGIKNNISKIKSYEGLHYCWVEEANKVSAKSWEDLIPTVRRDDSEIWITFNPELSTDYTFKRFVADPPGKLIKRSVLASSGNPIIETTEAFVVKMTWRDNPWFPEVLRKEMLDLRSRDEDAWLNVWEGNCRQALQGAVFAKELRDSLANGRITSVPWDRETPVDTFWDLGRRDMTAIWFGQRVGMQWRVLEYFEDSQEDIHYYLRYLQNRSYVYGTHYLPHDAKNKLLGVKRSIEQIVRAVYPSVHIVQRTGKKVNAINAARIIFPNCWFDEKLCAEGIERLRHYRYNIVDGQFSEEPLHDENSNGADAFMTLAQAIKAPRGSKSIAGKLLRRDSPLAESAPGLGWLA